MFFSTIKKCNDDRVIKTGLDAITEFRRAGVGVIAFACCFVKGTLVISFILQFQIAILSYTCKMSYEKCLPGV